MSAEDRHRLQELEARARRLEVVNQFARSLLVGGDIDDVLWDVCSRVVAHLGFEDCVIYLVDRDRDRLVQRAAYGPKNPREREILAPIEIPIGQGIVGSVAASGRVELVSDTRCDSRYIVDDVMRFSELAVPILHDGQVVGVIDSEHTQVGFFTEEHRELLITVASMASARIARSFLEDELRMLNRDLERKVAERTLALQNLNLALETRIENRTYELRASEERFERLFREAPQAMLIVNSERRVVQSNRMAQRLFRFEEYAFIGTPIDDLVPIAFAARHGLLMDGFMDIARPAASDREVQAIRRDGSVFSAEVGLVPIDIHGERHILAGVTDITDRLEAQSIVTRSLREKETLLKEIHHRVKNNLQIISSLLMFQSEQMPSDRARMLLEESVLRVRSMALIHQHLYGVESLERIDLGDYARSLAESLRGVLAPHARLRVDASMVEVTVNIAVPLGLILNELLTNAFKYGLPERAEGGEPTHGRTGEHFDIVVEVRVVEERIQVAVTDSGKGLPEGFDPERSTTLGLQLVRTLNRQIRGQLEFDVDRGSRFAVTCPH